MSDTFPLAAQSFSTWMNNAWFEMQTYCSHFDSSHWAIVAALAIGVGFVCMRGNPIR